MIKESNHKFDKTILIVGKMKNKILYLFSYKPTLEKQKELPDKYIVKKQIKRTMSEKGKRILELRAQLDDLSHILKLL